MFSAVAEDERSTILKNCLEPLLDLADKGYKFAIQISGLSLEIIHTLNPALIDRLCLALQEDNLELVGNGYSQIIQPLVPSEVNLQNQIFGKKIYKELLKQDPKLGTVNEMAYSKSSSKSFLDAGYESLIMEWNNSYKYNPHWHDEMRYFSHKINYKDNYSLDLIWGDSIIFQKFQRYVHGEIDLDQYLDWIQAFSKNNIQDGFLCLYCSDAEVFDFRPKRYGTESIPLLHEWKRIASFFESLEGRGMELVLPSKAVEHHEKYSMNDINLQTSASPIVVKKQEKYNINRWAITGKDDFHLNSRCFRVLSKFNTNTSELDWKNLLLLWSSDLRTHIESGRWNKAKILLRELEKKYNINESSQATDFLIKNNAPSNEIKKIITLKHDTNILEINLAKGLSLSSWNQNGKNIMGTIEHGYYDDISYAADFYSCTSIVEPLGNRKIADLNEIKEFNLTKRSVETSFISQGVKFYKKYQLINNNSFEINQSLEFPSRSKMKIAHSVFTFLPDAWDQDSLYFSTFLGGDVEETFFLNEEFDHSANLNLNVGSKNGFFSTKGFIMIGDQLKSISFQYNLAKSALMPKIVYKKVDSTNYFLRLMLFSQDTDETFVENKKPLSFHSKVLVSFHNSE